MDDCKYFWLDNIRCDTVGIRLQKPVTFTNTSPKMESISVPGRNGTLYYYDGSYKNVTGEASCFLLEKTGVSMALSAVARWTMMEPGYHRLETTEEPDTYRMALVSKGPETEIRMRVLAPFTLTFDCMPQKFLKSGETPVAISESGTVINNEWFPASPIITVMGSGSGTLSINDISMTLRDNFSGPLTYDADTENAYYGLSNKNGEIRAPERLILPHGECAITWDGGVESVSITPRWWTL